MRRSMQIAHSLFNTCGLHSHVLPQYYQPILERLTPHIISLLKKQSIESDDASLKRSIQDLISTAFYAGQKSIKDQCDFKI